MTFYALQSQFLLSRPPIGANISSLYNEAQTEASLLIIDEQFLSLVSLKVVKLRMEKGL